MPGTSFQAPRPLCLAAGTQPPSPPPARPPSGLCPEREVGRVEPQDRRDRFAAALTLAAAILLWGANWPVMKIGLEHVSPIWMSALRFATGAGCLLLVQAVQGTLRLPRAEDWPLVVSVGGLQMTLFTALVVIALTQLPAGRSAILSYTTPLWVAPASILLFREQVSAARIGGVLLAIIGVAVLVNPLTIDWSREEVIQAHAMLLGASFCWAVCILHLRHARGLSSAYALAPWQMLFATALLLVAAVVMEGPFTGDGSAGFWATLLFIGPVATAFCFCAVNAASTRLPATAISTVMLGVPATGIAISVTMLGEPLTPGLIVSSLAIASGVALAAIPARRSSAGREVQS